MKAGRFDLVIFDWDGTLADSTGLIVSSMQLAIRALELPDRDDDTIRQLIGLGMDDVLRSLYPELEQMRLRALLDGYRRHFVGAGHNEADLYGPARDVVPALHQGGYRLAIATGKSRPGLERALRHHSFVRPLMAATRTADETASKPDPLMLRELLDELSVPAERAVMVGDTDYDVLMARAIGMPAVGLTGGAHTRARLQDARPDAILDSLSLLPAWLATPG